jgi:hypothetical protein
MNADWFFQLGILTILGVLGFIAKRYLDVLTELIEKNTEAIDSIRDLIGGIRSSNAVQKTICEQRHKYMDEVILELKKKIP